MVTAFKILEDTCIKFSDRWIKLALYEQNNEVIHRGEARRELNIKKEVSLECMLLPLVFNIYMKRDKQLYAEIDLKLKFKTKNYNT